MKFVFSQLSEKDRRLYAGLETQKLPRGGQNYIADLFDCSPKTIRRGEKELEDKKLLETMKEAAKNFSQPKAARKISREIINLALEHAS